MLPVLPTGLPMDNPKAQAMRRPPKMVPTPLPDAPLTNYLTDVGAFSNSLSFYGTKDQTGLVYEWNDLSGDRSLEKGLRCG